MRKIRPGRLFWVGTFFVGVFSPGRGKRRVQQRMIRIDEEWRVAHVRAETLKEELDRSYEGNELLRKEIVRLSKVIGTLERKLATAVKANEENQKAYRVGGPAPQPDLELGRQITEAVRKFTEPEVTDREETVPLPKVTTAPGTHVYTMSRVPFPDAIAPFEKS